MHLPLRQLFLQHVAQTSPAPMALEPDRAEGIYIYGRNGERWIDFISGISVSNVGHRHPQVLEAIHTQLNKYLHLMVYGEYIQSPQVMLAQRLTSVLPGLDSVYFVNSGTEAIEGAIKLARRATGRKKIFSFRQAYHGSTTGALSLMSDEYFSAPFRPLLPETYHLPPHDLSALSAIDHETAAVFTEIIRGEAGAELIADDYLLALRRRCTEAGALLVVDEIQTGFGRTGKFFACSHVPITPDVLVIAKGMGGGMPIGAFLSSKALMSTLSDQPVLGHITTFGGHPVSCAAAIACFDIIQSLQIEIRIPEMEKLIRSRLVHPAIRNISGKGLLLAIEFDSPEFAQRVIAACVQGGLITDWFLFAAHKLRISPPLTITRRQAEDACTIILQAIGQCYSTEK